MPVEIKWEPHGMFRRFYGSFSNADMEAAHKGLYGDARFGNLCYVINDYTEGSPDSSIDEFAVEFATAIASAAMLTNPRLRFAFVATDPETLRLLALISSVPSHKVPFKIFSTLADARTWIETEDRYKP